jgi:hypothetical protein
MRPTLTVAICSVVLKSLFAQSPEPNTNTACIEKLQIPSYPLLARQARLRGVVVATTTLNSNGTIKSISIQMESGTVSATKILTSAVETALRSSVYTHACDGKPLKLIFNFVLGQDLLPNNDKQTVSFGYPNRFWIVAPPAVMNP